MGLVDDALDDAVKFGLYSGEFPGEETIIYKPLGGSNRSITAHVFRMPVESTGEITAAPMEIRVRNSATTGIAMTEIDISGDRVNLAYRKGGTARDYRIAALVTTDCDAHETVFRVMGRGD